MNIVVTYDASGSSRAPASFKTVVADVVKYFDSQFANPITINIDVGWGEVNGSKLSAGALGESITNLTLGTTYAQIKAALTAIATTSGDKSAVGSLPSIDPTKGGDFAIPTAEAKALGLLGASSDVDGFVGFDNTAGTFDFGITSNTGGTVPSGEYDLFGVVAHEFSEVLGRQMNFGVSFGAGTGHVFEPLDLFDFTASGVRSLNPATAGRYFSVDNGATNLDPYSNDPGGDQFDWAAGAGNDSYDAFGNPGVINSVSAADLLLMNLLGYTPTPDFTASALTLNGAALSFRINDIAQGAGAASIAGIYLSTDATITIHDTHLTNAVIPAVAAGGLVAGLATVVLPSTLTPGTYYLGVIADVNGAVAQSNSLNDASTGLAITVVDSSNIATISGVAAARAFDVAGATLASALTLDGSLVTSAALGGAQTVTVAGGNLTLEAGTALTVASINMTSTTSSLNALTSVSYAGRVKETLGAITAAAGDQLSFTDTSNLFSGTLSGAGTIAFTAGSDTLSGTTLAATAVNVAGAAVTLSGAISLTKTLNVTATNLKVAAGGATLSGGGSLILSNATTNLLKGVSAAATLTNVGDKILGAGQLGGGVMKLVNSIGGLIDGDDAAALTINTGANTITNAGVIENTSTGGTTIASAVDNTGVLTVTAGVLTVTGAVTGTGKLTIAGGTADLAGAFTQNVTFSKAAGVLELGKSQTYGGTVTGLSTSGANSLDLGDIAFASATTKATYAGTTTAGILTVTDGTHTAKIHLAGNYTASTFKVSSDGHGGTTVVDPTGQTAGSIVAAIASFAPTSLAIGASGAASSVAGSRPPHVAGSGLETHPLPLRQGGDAGRSDGPRFVVQPAFGDGDAVRRLMIDHLHADPRRRGQAMQIERGVAVDPRQASFAGVGVGAGEIHRQRGACERREGLAADQLAHLAHPQSPGTQGSEGANDRPGQPHAAHVPLASRGRGDLVRGWRVPTRRRPYSPGGIGGAAQKLAGGARHRAATAEELRIDDLDPAALAHGAGGHGGRRQVGQAIEIGGQPGGHQVRPAVQSLDLARQKADHHPRVQRSGAPRPTAHRPRRKRFAVAGEEGFLAHARRLGEIARSG